MRIRLAEPRDLDAVVAVDPLAEREPSRRGFLEAALQSRECWLAERAGEVLGFLVLDYSFYANGFVALLVVRPESRRQGVGRALLEYAAAACTTSKLFTSTNESNLEMRSLLGSAGFEPSGVIHNLDAGDPELVFVRSLAR